MNITRIYMCINKEAYIYGQQKTTLSYMQFIEWHFCRLLAFPAFKDPFHLFPVDSM